MSLKAAIACTRFGLGAKSGEIQKAQSNPEAWLLRQLSPSANKFPRTGLAGTARTLSSMTDINMQGRAMKKAGKSTDETDKERRKLIRSTFQAEIQARLKHGATTTDSFHERLTRFWSNHFSVSAKNAQMRVLAGAYEREAIRPNILGNFADLAEAAILHAGMLVYLDNIQSFGPNSRAGKRRKRGLNENLAREILELHTLTPEANYSQSDVTEFARALTGWTINRSPKMTGKPGEVVFESRIHEPGSRKILGRNYPDDGGAQAKNILRDVCASPHTAHNICFKLAKHFLADNPPPALVNRLKASFLGSGGNLKALYKTLIDSPEMWEAPAQKVKTPEELLVSTARLIGVQPALADRPNAAYKSLAQSPFSAPSPQGWPDDASHWIGADSITKRIEWANRVAQRNAKLDARTLLLTGLGERLSAQTLTAISRAESGQQALALALLSPDFQRR